MILVSRAGWGARPAKSSTPLRLPSSRPVTIHHLAADWHGASGMRAAQNLHMDARGWADFGYHFAVDTDGTVYVGRPYGVQGAHSDGENDESHGIVFMGNFEDEWPTWPALDACAELLAEGHRRGWWPASIVGHRDNPGEQTACPGAHLHDLLPELDRKMRAALAPTAPPTPEADDMPDKPDWLPSPIMAMRRSPLGGYYLAAADGGVFSFGGAPFHGSIGSIGATLAFPVTGIEVTETGGGYWLVCSDGGVFAFGDAGYLGSMPDDMADGKLDGKLASQG